MEVNEIQLAEALGKALAPMFEQSQQRMGVSQYGNYWGRGYKADGTPHETSYLYEGGGLFGRCDGPSQLINALVGPNGFESVLTWQGTDTENEYTDALTGITVSSGEQSSACGDCQTVTLKACAQLYPFGRFCRQTQELQFDRLGVRANDGVPVKVLFGSLTDPAGNVILRQGETITDAFFLQARTAGYALRLRNGELLWQGNPSNNTGQAYKEYKGFELIVNTGKYDAYTETDCDALDSFLLNANNAAIASDGDLSINNYFRRIVLEFKTRAAGAGLDWDTAQMYIVMTDNMWEGVAKRYACGGLDLCNITNTNANAMRGDMNQAMTRYEEYLNRMALPIYGRWYPVIIDNLIPETAGQENGICSDIYFMTTVIQGETVLYGQYQDFNMTYGRTRNELVSLFGSDDIAITDNGRYALVRDNSRGCFDMQVYAKPRVVSKMPWLLGRLQNVCHDPLGRPLPDVSGSGRLYERGGGRSITPVPTLYP